MKKLLSFFLVLLATTTLWAYDFQSGDLYYDIISNHEPYTVEVASNGGQYSGDITIPETVENNGITYSVTRIGAEAFGNCLALTSITIPNSVTSIGGHAFISCYALTSIIIPDSVISIGSSAFSSCMSLTSISLPSNLTTIQLGTFSECTSLKSITLGENITTIEDHAFVRCDLEEIYVSALTPPILGRLVFDSSPTCYIPCGASAAYKATNWKDYVKCFVEECVEDSTWEIFYTSTDGNIVIPYKSNIFDANIVSNTYSNGQGVITFDGPITRIDDYAFMFCESLASIIIPYGVISIGKAAFSHCSALKSITISNSVTTIGEAAFYQCYSIDTIYCYATTPPDINDNSFNYYSYPTLYVPCDALEDYQAHSIWGRFANIDCIASEEVETQETVVDPSTNEVTITWPMEANAATYTIVIQSGDEVICTLRFNAQGQLLTIAYAPGREGNHPAQYAEQTAKGFRFTVTGLEQGTHYTYDITVQDANNHTILSHTGEFTTESMTAVDDITTNDKNTQKLLRDNQLYIYHNGSAYTIMGQKVSENF